jgi:hypothetical protein
VQAHADVPGREAEHRGDFLVRESLEGEHHRLAERQRQPAHGGLQPARGLEARRHLVRARQRVGDFAGRVEPVGGGRPRGDVGEGPVGGDAHHERLLRGPVPECGQGAPQGEGDVLQELLAQRRPRFVARGEPGERGGVGG